MSQDQVTGTEAQNTEAVQEQPKRVITLPSHLKNVEVKEVKFNFKKDKELGTKRPSVELGIPVPTVDGVVDILTRGEEKEVALLMDAIHGVVVDQARQQVNDKEDITQENLDMDKLTWTAIANLPPAARRGGGIAKEQWEEFGKDYGAVMPAVTGKTAEQIGNAVKILLAKFQPIKTNKPVLKFFKEQLALYIANTPNLEEYQENVDFLNNKVDELLQADEAALLNNL